MYRGYGMKLIGTNAVIEIVEADKAPNIINKNEYCSIVAKKDSMIYSVSAQNGTPLVEEGDIVKKGTALIGGWMEGKYTGTRYVHATGDVKGKVWYSEKEKVYYKQDKKKETGRAEKKYSININNFAINFYKKLSKFEIYDTISEEKKIRISSNFYLPIKFVIIENHEMEKYEITYSKEEAIEVAKKDLLLKLDEKVQNKEDIINTYIHTNESKDYIEVEVIYEVLENIGTEEKIAL